MEKREEKKAKKREKSVCYFGRYSKEVMRTKVFIAGLKKQGFSVIECTTKSSLLSWKPQSTLGFYSYHLLSLFKDFYDYCLLIFQFMMGGRKADCVIVGYPWSGEGILSGILCKIFKKKQYIDFFMSLEETLIEDRKLVPRKGLMAKKLRFIDKWAYQLSDVITTDTKEHSKYFREKFESKGTNKNRLKKHLICPVGTMDRSTLLNGKKSIKVRGDKTFYTVFFYGTFIPLQGIGFILKAAKIIEKMHGNKKIKFVVVGDGQTKKEMVELADELKLTNVQFLPFIPYTKLRMMIETADLCLGIFGETKKTQKVIPNKAYDVIASGKPLLTGDTPAIQEYFKHRKNCYLCPVANEEELAKAILFLQKNPILSKRIAKAGYALYEEHFNPGKVTNILVDSIKSEILK